ncbi:hypothetical protein C663_3562 [Bacillus subtilis XF-1]|nr:hypothetical protein C663_3562 [Bacillus subtilis XF-1]ASK25707.1 hypothetical protein BSSX_3843 [Bacillus subtilis]
MEKSNKGVLMTEMYCTEESVGSQRECEKTVNIDTSGIQ